MKILKKLHFCLISALMILFSISIAGCGNKTEQTSSNSSAKTETETKENTDNKESSSNTYKVGDKITFEGEEVTVVSVERNYNTGNQYQTPKDGEEFVKISINIKNVSNKNISVNPLEFKIQSSDGALESPNYNTYSLDDQFESAELVPEGTRSGSIIFEVPKDDANLKLVYTPSILSAKSITIEL